MTSIADSPLRRALEKLRPVAADRNAKRLDPSKIHQDPEMKRAITKQFAELRARNAELKRMGDKIGRARAFEDQSIRLPNITSLDLIAATKIRDWVAADVEANADRGMVVCGHDGDQKVSSLKDYLSRITAHIDKISKAAPPSTQPVPSETEPASTPSAGASPTDAPLPTSPSETAAVPAVIVPGADPNWTDPVGLPGQNHIRFPNVASLTREMAAAVYQQVSTMVRTRDISGSVIHAKNGAAGTYSMETYMSWLAQRAATDIVA